MQRLTVEPPTGDGRDARAVPTSKADVRKRPCMDTPMTRKGVPSRMTLILTCIAVQGRQQRERRSRADAPPLRLQTALHYTKLRTRRLLYTAADEALQSCPSCATAGEGLGCMVTLFASSKVSSAAGCGGSHREAHVHDRVDQSKMSFAWMEGISLSALHVATSRRQHNNLDLYYPTPRGPSHPICPKPKPLHVGKFI